MKETGYKNPGASPFPEQGYAPATERTRTLLDVRGNVSEASQAIVHAISVIRQVAGDYPPDRLGHAVKGDPNKPGSTVDELLMFAEQLRENTEELNSAINWLEARCANG